MSGLLGEPTPRRWSTVALCVLGGALLLAACDGATEAPAGAEDLVGVGDPAPSGGAAPEHDGGTHADDDGGANAAPDAGSDGPDAGSATPAGESRMVTLSAAGALLNPFALEEVDGGFVFAGLKRTGANPNDNDMLIGRVTFEGDVQWARTVGGAANDQILALAPLAGGGWVGAGVTRSSPVGTPNSDAALVFFTSAGQVQRTLAVGTSGDEDYLMVSPVADGFVAVGSTTDAGSTDRDGVITRFDATGGILWNRRYAGATGTQELRTVRPLGDGFLVFGMTSGGLSSGGVDATLSKVGLDGALHWSHGYGGAGDEMFFTGLAAPDGSSVAAGFTTSAGAGGEDALIAAFDPLGRLRWARVLGGQGTEQARALALDARGAVLVQGYTIGPSGAERDVWVARLELQTGALLGMVALGNASPAYADHEVLVGRRGGGVSVLYRSDGAAASTADLVLASLNSALRHDGACPAARSPPFATAATTLGSTALTPTFMDLAYQPRDPALSVTAFPLAGRTVCQ